jgi:beta-phosphoglucomutase
MLQAIIFDFDGVVIDSEPIHLECFRQVLRQRYAIEITQQEYYERYIAYSDAESFEHMAEDHGLTISALEVRGLVAEKTVLVQRVLRQGIEPLPGAAELMSAIRQAGLALGVCSSAARKEIEIPLEGMGLRPLVQEIVAAEDVVHSKPDPACYDLARRKLGLQAGRELAPGNCIAIEDSPGGVASATGAGLRVLAVTNTVAAEKLRQAHRIVDSLAQVDVNLLRAMAEGEE